MRLLSLAPEASASAIPPLAHHVCGTFGRERVLSWLVVVLSVRDRFRLRDAGDQPDGITAGVIRARVYARNRLVSRLAPGQGGFDVPQR